MQQNPNNQFLKLEYIFSDNKEDINEGIKEAQIFAIENDQSIILTYKNIDCHKLESSLLNKEENDVEPYGEKEVRKSNARKFENRTLMILTLVILTLVILILVK